jgi:hypothetical protein
LIFFTIEWDQDGKTAIIHDVTTVQKDPRDDALQPRIQKNSKENAFGVLAEKKFDTSPHSKSKQTPYHRVVPLIAAVCTHGGRTKNSIPRNRDVFTPDILLDS